MIDWTAIVSGICAACAGFALGAWWTMNCFRLTAFDVRDDLKQAAQAELERYVNGIKRQENLKWMRRDDGEDF